MNLDRFRSLIEGSTERRDLEFKGNCSWDVKTMAKDVLAMANNPLGGNIVFGINDDLEKVGLSEEYKKSFSQETIEDQIGNYADPFVEIKISNISYEEKDFVVLSVSEFAELPVLCKKDSDDAQKGALYVRPRNGRPQSAAVPDSNEMRDVIERSIAKRAKKLEDLGLSSIVKTSSDHFDSELGGL